MGTVSAVVLRRSRRAAVRTLVVVTFIVVVAAGLVAQGGAAGAAVPTTVSPVLARSASSVTSTALATAQVDGVVFAQAVSGNTVYVGGKFATARPAGVDAGGAGQVTRTNLMAFDITTGVMTSFAPTLNGGVQALALSPDGSRLYVGGQFTSVNGQNRYRVAAFDTATGALIATFAPTLDYLVYAIAVTDSAVYLGGAFTNAGGNSRPYLAAYSPAGALLAWNPVADAPVRALAVTPGTGRVVAGGAFGTLNGTTARGLGSLDPVTGATQPFPVNTVLYSYGTKAAFFSLVAQGNTVYGSAYNYGGTGNLEGAFAADAGSGELTWVEDCHGDTYNVFPTPDQVYVVGHPHFCSNVGGFGQQDVARRALAFTTAATGTVQTNTQNNYANLAGNPSPSMTAWFPSLNTGTVTGSNQAAWSVAGDSRYVVLGGEFTRVNGVAQQGLVRFAVSSVTPDRVAPTKVDTAFVPTSSSLGSGALRLAFPANWDADDLSLDYQVQRDTGSGTSQQLVWQTTASSTFWTMPTLAVADTGLNPGTAYRYRLVATDAAGNQAVGAWTTITAPTSGWPGFNRAPVAAASATVSADGASVAVDGTGSYDSDGQVSRYRWDFGDGTSATTPTATHRYTASGTYSIRLTVTDDDAATASTTLTRTVTVNPVPPTASFTTAQAGLTVYGDGRASSDVDGTVVGWNWDFGDGASASGSTATHVYAADGTYHVTLTVTDDSGLSGTTTSDVTVSAAGPVAADAFERAVSGGWGTADVGGAWTVGAPATAYAVSGGTATQTLAGPGSTDSAVLGAVTAGDVVLTVDSTVATAASGNGITLSTVARRVGSNDYRLKLRLLPGGAVHLAVSAVVGGAETVVREVNVPGLNYTPGTTLTTRFTVSGGATATLTGSVWRTADGVAPAAPQLSTTFTSNVLAAPGAVGLQSYVSSGATAGAVTAAFDALRSNELLTT